MSKLLLSDREVRDEYGLRSLPQMRVRGASPPFIKIGRRVFYERETLENWLAARRRRSTSDLGAVA
jgi:hypothetical protein